MDVSQILRECNINQFSPLDSFASKNVLILAFKAFEVSTLSQRLFSLFIIVVRFPLRRSASTRLITSGGSLCIPIIYMQI